MWINIEKFESKDLPNLHLEFTEDGLKVTVTLNIPKDLRPYLAKNKVQKCKKLYVYWCSYTITCKPTKQVIIDIYNQLMSNAMINVRNAKIQKIEVEKQKIINQPILF